MDKEDTVPYRNMILKTWAAQLIIIFILFTIVIIITLVYLFMKAYLLICGKTLLRIIVD